MQIHQLRGKKKWTTDLSKCGQVTRRGCPIASSLHLSPHSVREMEDACFQSWNGCTCEKIVMNLVPQVVEE